MLKMPPAKQIRILVVDRHALIREGLCSILAKQDNLVVVGEAGDCDQAIALAGEQQPDIILAGLIMGNNKLLVDCFAKLQAAAPQAKILVVTGLLDLNIHQRAVQAGAMGVVHKNQNSRTLLKAIEKVYLGEAWLDHKLTARILTALSKPALPKDPDSESIRLSTLTRREMEIALLLGDGLKPQQIADVLFVSRYTVRNHISAIYGKLGVRDRFELRLILSRNSRPETETSDAYTREESAVS